MSDNPTNPLEEQIHRLIIENRNIHGAIDGRDQRAMAVEIMHLIQQEVRKGKIAELEELGTFAYQQHEDKNYSKKLEARIEARINQLKGEV
jgi:hypothetical protein